MCGLCVRHLRVGLEETKDQLNRNIAEVRHTKHET
jgi:hypothetical protein